MRSFFQFTSLICVSTCILSGCQVVNIKSQSTGTVLSSERNNILTHSKLSEASLNTLSLISTPVKACDIEPNECIEKIKSIPALSEEQYLSTAAEIHLAQALKLKDSSECNPSQLLKKFKSEADQTLTQNQYQGCMSDQIEALSNVIRYSYAYLFETKQPASKRIFNNRQVQIKDFYNQSVANLINSYNDLQKSKELLTFKPISNTAHSRYLLDTSLFPTLRADKIEQLVSTYNLSFSGLKSINRRDGFGSEFAIKFKPDQKDPFTNYEILPLEKYRTIAEHPNIHEAAYVPVTIVIEPKQIGSIDAVLNSKAFNIKLIDPNAHSEAVVDQQHYPITANYSASYALWLANNNLGASAYWTLLDREHNLIMPHLFMLEPYNPNKKIIIMVHGLASSPEAWIDMTNDIMGDATLRQNYQVWQVFYSTNMPILESRYQIYALLEQAFKDLEQQYPEQPPRDNVLVGHSMGGVISRLLVSSDDFTDSIMQYMQDKNGHKYRDVYQSEVAAKRFKMDALKPEIKRAIFISSPLQGTDYADRWFTLLARKIIKLPEAFLKVTIDSLQGNLGEASEGIKHLSTELLQNGPSDLSKKSAFMQITGKANIDPAFKYHVIMGNNTKFSEYDLINDGVVPYQSAHLAGAESEKIITGGHSIQYTSEAVIELRRILHQHLQQLPK